MPDLPPDLALTSLERMVTIRAVEEAICEEYGRRNIRGPVHLSIGQEAAAVGVLSACRPDDVTVSTHRDHAHYLAKGGSVAAMVDELYGLESGCSRGHGGSMHLFAPDVGFVGASAVLPGATPVAVGLGFGCAREGRGRIAVGFSGDGAADEGAFFEALNLAAVLSVPVLLVCENNGLSTNTPLGARQAQGDIGRKAEAFGVPTRTVDGLDVFAVNAAAAAAAERVRSGGGPVLLVITTDRLCAHVGPIASLDPLDRSLLLDGGDGRSAQATSADPIAHCLGVVLRGLPELRPRCESILETVPDAVRAEFRRADGAFQARNAVFRLAAPPPPRSHAV